MRFYPLGVKTMNLTPKSPVQMVQWQTGELRGTNFVNCSHQRLKASGYSHFGSPVIGVSHK